MLGLLLPPPLGTDGGPAGCLARIVSPGRFPPTSRRFGLCASCTPLSVFLGCCGLDLSSIEHVCSNVSFNLLVGDASEVARMNDTAYSLLCLTPQAASNSKHNYTHFVNRLHVRGGSCTDKHKPASIACPFMLRRSRRRIWTSPRRACSVSLFPQRGTCPGTAERVGQDQSTFTFGRCVSTVVRCCRFPSRCGALELSCVLLGACL